MEQKEKRYNLAFGALMAKSRKAKGMSQTEVAEILDITQAYYSQLENRKRSIDLCLAIRACKALGVDLTELSFMCT